MAFFGRKGKKRHCLAETVPWNRSDCVVRPGLAERRDSRRKSSVDGDARRENKGSGVFQSRFGGNIQRNDFPGGRVKDG